GISLLGFGAYPDRPITIICPWAPGGGGVVGHFAGAQAAPDGYTLTLVTLEIATMHWLGLTDLTYTDYEPIALINADYAAINVRADAPWETYIELHTQICKNPGKLLASGTAVGGIWDIARAGWLRAAGFNVNGCAMGAKSRGGSRPYRTHRWRR
ncbi:MAG: tripartite tricarboxylate transporter substrate-binding protein, partial [Candidatus Bipolaricaulaceae bacterium]